MKPFCPLLLRLQWYLGLFYLSSGTCLNAAPSIPLPLEPPLLHVGQNLSHIQVRNLTQDHTGALWIATAQGLDRMRESHTAHFNTTNTVLLPDARLTSMVQESSGLLWFGTYGGLVLHDASSFTHFNALSGLPDDRITSLLNLGDRLWIGTWRGLGFYLDQRFTRLEMPKKINNKSISTLHLDENGNLWIGFVHEGLWRYDGETFAAVGDTPLQIHALYRDRRSTLWVSTWDQGLFQYDSRSGKLVPTDLRHVLCLLEDRTGRLWAGTRKGLYRHQDGTWRAADAPALVHVPISALIQDERGGLCVGTWGQGLWQETERGFTAASPLSDRQIKSLLLDRHQRLWAATDRGIFRSSRGNWENLTPDKTIRGVNSLFEDGSGRIWAGGDTGGLLRFDEERATHFHPAHYLANTRINAMVSTAQKQLWIGTANGLFAYDGEQFLPYDSAAGLPHPVVYALASGTDHSLWIGTANGLGRWQQGSIATLVSGDALPDPAIRALVEDRSGNLWIGTSAGLVRLRHGQLELFERTDGLPHDNIRALALDSHDQLWVATSGGLARFDGHRFHTFTKASGLNSNLLYALLVDRSDGIWTGSLSGGLNYYDGRRFFHLTVKEGLPSNTVRHLFQDGDGHIWIATDKGLARYHRDAIPASAASIPYEIIAGLAALGAGAAAIIALRRRRSPTAR